MWYAGQQTGRWCVALAKGRGGVKWLFLGATGLVVAVILTVVVQVTVQKGAEPKPPPTPTASLITAAQVREHMWGDAIVCGTVMGSGPITDWSFATGIQHIPSFLNFDRPWPDQPFRVVIWDDDWDEFPENFEAFYKGKQVCATGYIQTFAGEPAMKVRHPDQIEILG